MSKAGSCPPSHTAGLPSSDAGHTSKPRSSGLSGVPPPFAGPENDQDEEFEVKELNGKKQPFDLLFLDAFCVVGGVFPTISAPAPTAFPTKRPGLSLDLQNDQTKCTQTLNIPKSSQDLLRI